MSFIGSVVAVSGDRAFVRTMDRYLMVPHDGTVLSLPSYESALEALMQPEGAAEVRQAKPLSLPMYHAGCPQRAALWPDPVRRLLS